MAVKKSKPRQSNKRKPFWERVIEWNLIALKRLLIPSLCIWLIAWMAIGGVFEKTRDMAWNNVVEWSVDKGLIVQDVIINGRVQTNLADLQRAINIAQNAPILSVNVDAIQQKISTLPWVKNVRVSRAFNGIVTVTLIEKIPFVLWDRPGRSMVVVDTDGAIIEGAKASAFSDLLTVRGVDAPKFTVDLMRMILAEPDVAKHVKGAEWIGGRRWDLITTKGTRILLPANDMGYALSRLAKSQNEKNILNRNLLSVDLRGADRIIIETNRGESQDLMNLSATDNNMI